MKNGFATHERLPEQRALLISFFLIAACSADPKGPDNGAAGGGGMAGSGAGGTGGRGAGMAGPGAGGNGTGGSGAGGIHSAGAGGATLGAGGSGAGGAGAGGAGAGGFTGAAAGAAGVSTGGGPSGGSGGMAAGSGGTAFTGKLGTLGAVLPTVSSFYITVSFPRAETLLYASSAPLTCDVLKTAGWAKSLPAGAQVINIVVQGAAGVMSYPVGGFGQGEVNYAPGGAVGTSSEVAASSGTITFTKATANGPVEGTAMATYASGDSVSGSFHAEYCAGGAEY
jgi:hypothetical protein